MEIGEVNWSSALDGESFQLDVKGFKVEGCHWKCSGETNFVILFLHGLCSNMELNAHFLREFPHHGFAAMAIDHLGNGKSQGPRGSQTIADIEDGASQLIRYARSLYPTTPIFLMGHSMGGLAVFNMALRNHKVLEEVSGLVCHSPWLTTDPSRIPGSIKFILMKILSYVYPSYKIETGLSPEKSSYPQGFKDMAMQCDSFFSFMTARLIESVFREQSFAQSHAENYNNKPLLFLQGTTDNCVHAQANVEIGEKLAAEKPGLVSFKVFTGGAHDLLKDWTRKETLEAIFTFARAQNSPTGMSVS